MYLPKLLGKTNGSLHNELTTDCWLVRSKTNAAGENKSFNCACALVLHEERGGTKCHASWGIVTYSLGMLAGGALIHTMEEGRRRGSGGRG